MIDTNTDAGAPAARYTLWRLVSYMLGLVTCPGFFEPFISRGRLGGWMGDAAA